MSEIVKPGWRFGPKILAPMVAVTIATVLLAAFGLYWAASRSDAVSVERQVRTTQRAIDDSLAGLALEQEAVAVWDQPILRLKQPRPDMTWIDDNIGGWLHKMYAHDQTIILDAHDVPVYANDGGTRVPASHFEALRPDLQRLIDRTRGRIRHPSGPFDRHPGQKAGSTALTTSAAVHDTQIVNVAGRPAAASVMLMRSLVPGVSQPGAEPVMVSLRFLDGGFLHQLARRNLIASPRFSQSDQLLPGEQSLPLTDEGGRTIGHFMWRPELPGTRIMKVLGPITGLLILAMFGMMGRLGLWLRRSTTELNETLFQLSASEAQAQHLAFHDTLTGLPNRALFNDRLNQALSLVRRGQGLALILLDLDRFKDVNDTLGHLAGDALLREFGMRLADLMRDGDTVARLGGDEFALLLPGMDRPDEVEEICLRILAVARDRFELSGNGTFIGVSMGAIMAPQSGLNAVELMRKGDIALYCAKAEGRNCYRLFSEAMDERIKLRCDIEDDLRSALEKGDQLRVYYQPEMGAHGDSVVGLEALVRWQHPDRGLISPEDFVPVAEETGLISQLGEWVLAEACRTARRWPHLFIAVNLSPVQFRITGFADRLIAIARKASVDPRQIELEVTEGVLLDVNDLVCGALAKLRSAGFRIALDDFGTGYSSLSYLRRFEVDKIKIDRSFVQHLGHRVDSAALVTAVVSIGQAMGLTVTAEGVETEEQRRFLSLAGCNQMQGFLFSRPLPGPELASFLLRRGEVRDAA